MEAKARKPRAQTRGVVVQISLKLTPFELAVIDAAADAGSRQAFIREAALSVARDVIQKREGSTANDALPAAPAAVRSKSKTTTKARSKAATEKRKPVAAAPVPSPARKAKGARPSVPDASPAAETTRAIPLPQSAATATPVRASSNVDRQEPRPPVRSEDEPAKMRVVKTPAEALTKLAKLPPSRM